MFFLCLRNGHVSMEEVKPSTQQIPSTTHPLLDSSRTDGEDYMPTDDHDVPMFVQHMEAMLEEIDLMDAEVEMEDLDADDPVVDIDSFDKNNPLAVTEYVEIYMHTTIVPVHF